MVKKKKQGVKQFSVEGVREGGLELGIEFNYAWAWRIQG